MSWVDQLYLKFPYVKFKNLKGLNGSNSNSISIGGDAGFNNQGIGCIAIGNNSGLNLQNNYGIAIGGSAGLQQQGENSIAIGSSAASQNQNTNSIAIGNNAASQFQNTNCIAIGNQAGQYYQQLSGLSGASGIAIGNLAGYQNQAGGIAIGYQSGYINQLNDAIAIGFQAGNNAQSEESIAIGYQSGWNNQNPYSIGIGYQAGQNTQNSYSIAMGYLAGNNLQKSNSIAIGYLAGQTTQQDTSIAIGYNAGNSSQQNNAISIGSSAGYNTQFPDAISIGSSAGYSNQGNYAIAIGSKAGLNNQHQQTIILNASGGTLDSQNIRSTYINPIRQAPNNYMLLYNEEATPNQQITYEVTKQPFKVMLDTHYLPFAPSLGSWILWSATGTTYPGININVSNYTQNPPLCPPGECRPKQDYDCFIGNCLDGKWYIVLKNGQFCEEISSHPAYERCSPISAWIKITLDPQNLPKCNPIHLRVYFYDESNKYFIHFDWSVSFEYIVMMSQANVFDYTNWVNLDPPGQYEYYIPLLIPTNHTISYNWCACPYPP